MPSQPLLDTHFPAGSEVSNDEILGRFLDYVASKGLELYPAQEQAILELLDGKNVILNTPTGSGKSLVALALHFQSLARGRRSFYTCPIKALVNEKFRDLCATFGPERVGMITGDGSVNPEAPIICCTAEILSNLALREGEASRADDIVMDEFHYYSDKQRGVAWQIPLLTLSYGRFLLMSATLGDMDFFAGVLTNLTQKSTEIVRSTDRPVPLNFEYRETPLHETLQDLVDKGQSPIYLVNFSQREAAEEAQNLLSVDFASKEEKKKIQEELEGTRFDSPYGKDIQRLLRHGVGIHHAGLLPKYRILVERLAQKGLLKVISGTDTLGVGVNVPIRTVLFTKLCKYDGEKTAILTVREFHQISGRAGRRGFDSSGNVVAQAPAHVIENLRMKAKAANDPKKAKKLVMKGPPPHGFVMWSKDTFDKLIVSQPEALVSRFHISHGILLNVLSRPSDGPHAMKKLIRASHGTAHSKKSLRKTAFELFRTLLDRNLVEIIKDSPRPRVRINVELQDDFSLNQTLSLYLLDALQVLDREDPEYALTVLTLVESILEDPDLILRRQLDRVKTAKMAEMKANGVEYEERMEELEKLEYPKPNRDFIYTTFNEFAGHHPWVGQENIRPKSIAREMYENFYSFADYVREYDLQRVEGILLRYISETYKVLVQTVPDALKNEEIHAIILYFGTMVRTVDSSLIDDWERMQNKTAAPKAAPAEEPKVDRKPLERQIRNEVHRFLRTLISRDYEAAAVLAKGNWTAMSLEARMKEFIQDHGALLIDPAARHPQNTVVHWEKTPVTVEQRLVDARDYNDWVAVFEMSGTSLVHLGPIDKVSF